MIGINVSERGSSRIICGLAGTLNNLREEVKLFLFLKDESIIGYLDIS